MIFLRATAVLSIATLFPLPLAAQTVSAGNVQLQHGVNRIAEAFSLDTVSVKDYGAVADGASHPACSALGLTTLAQLQAYKGGLYSFATACTNELDWLASQSTVNAVGATGGQVFLPRGTYTFDQPLVLPNLFDQTGAAKGLYLEGDGSGGTFVQPSVADFGAGSALISCGPVAATYSDNSGHGSGRYTVTGGCFGGIENLTLNNPYQTSSATVSSASYAGGLMNVPAPANGTTLIQMGGIKLGARMYLRRFAVWGFRMGLNVVGDHMTWDQVTLNHNFCGLYFAPASIYLQGDVVMTNHNFINANYLAGICVDKDAVGGVYQEGELYVGYQPYGIFKFAGISDSYGQPYGGGWSPTLQNAQFDHLQGEDIGNAEIWDDNLTVSTGGINTSSGAFGGIGATTINSVFFTYGTSQGQQITTGGRGSYAYIGAAFINGLIIRMIPTGNNNFYPTTGTLAGIATGGIGYSTGGTDLSGDMPGILSAYSTAGVEFVGKLPTGNQTCQSVTLHYSGVWDGGMIAITSAGASPVVGQTLQASTTQGAVIGNGTQPILGIAMGQVTNTAGGLCVPYANHGYVTVSTTGTITQGLLLIGAAGGSVTSVSSTGGYTVGIAQSASSKVAALALGGFVPNLTVGSITSGSVTLGTVINTNQAINGLVFGSSVGSAIASASTIAPSAGSFHVTGTTAVANITAPSFCTQAGTTCQLTLIPEGLWTTNTSGNISVGTNAVLHRALIMTYDPASSKWYPSY